jgi:hypothetical protein
MFTPSRQGALSGKMKWSIPHELKLIGWHLAEIVGDFTEALPMLLVEESEVIPVAAFIFAIGFILIFLREILIIDAPTLAADVWD